MKIIPKKSLGQNFLIDKNIIGKICDAGHLSRNDTVLEIGPGTGNLTEFILEKINQILPQFTVQCNFLTEFYEVCS